ncbi:MAG: hypothetical protein R3307_10270 [Anaerolineales bacterium]|nr:hypothetical protein [Anaerolineales bacterium]
MNEAIRNLVLAHVDGITSSRDFETIADKIREQASDIQVFVTRSNAASSRTAKKAATLPTLIVSIGPLTKFRPRRGKIYAGKYFSKVRQLQRLAAAGIPVPQWVLLEETTVLDPAEWGPTVAIKPATGRSRQGRGVQFVVTENVRFLSPDSLPERHLGRFGPMFVQQFIDTGKFPSEYRVVCLFGTPLLAGKRLSQEARPQPSQSYILNDHRDLITYRDTKRFGFSDVPMGGSFAYDEDILDLARRTYQAIPEAPLNGVDILREAVTGALYVMEVNPLGYTWHFSSGFAAQNPLIDGMRREEQMDAFSVAAKVLIERTRAEAI